MNSGGEDMLALLRELWPLHRTVNSDDLERALEICGEYVGNGFRIQRFAPKTDAMTWWLPERFHVREAWLEIAGERVADFDWNPLHLLSYSLPHRIEGRLGDLRDHLWTEPRQPDAIPWVFRYYERSWGFCLADSVLARFADDDSVRGVIDTEFTDEPFCIADCYLPGKSDDDLCFLTNICHPAQVNDSLTGLVVACEMFRQLSERRHRHYGFRVLIVPEQIGTICWFHANPMEGEKIRHAWFAEMLGKNDPFCLQLSRESDSAVDRAFQLALCAHRGHGEEGTVPFRRGVCSDEIVTDGPGLHIPTPSLTRVASPGNPVPYPEYHTSNDCPDIVDSGNLEEALEVALSVFNMLDCNEFPQRTFIGPVMLSRHGLWVDWRENLELNRKTEDLMFLLDGDKSLIDIAWELELSFEVVADYVGRLETKGLVALSRRPWRDPPPSLGRTA